MNESILKVSKVFFGYKLVLTSLLYAVPRQYDTSTHLFLTGCEADASMPWKVLAHGIEKLVIWDSVFYVHGAERGLIYEHEWAFGRLWSLLIGYLTPKRLVEWDESPLGSTYYYGLTGILISIASHYLSTIVLYYLTKLVFDRRKDSERYARIVATLYALSPAGMFLIAGYSESSFALASFVGLYLRQRGYYILSGVSFAISCGLRGNGILWGLVFLYDLAKLSVMMLGKLGEFTSQTGVRGSKELGWGDGLFSRKEPIGGAPRGREAADPRGLEDGPQNIKAIAIKMIRVIIGGSLIGAMVIGLQLYPYLLFCPGRPWCENTVPSIFGYVQSEYWNVGFMKYWTPNNVPNFLFGAPTLYLLYKSFGHYRHMYVLHPLLLVQGVIFVAAVFVYHVQIITRIATCLPVMYWYVGSLLTSTNLKQVKQGKRVVKYFILWTMAHAILFGAFLPPA